MDIDREGGANYGVIMAGAGDDVILNDFVTSFDTTPVADANLLRRGDNL